jgi:hypothetical protein
MNQAPLRNRHAADELAEVRAEIKALETRQEELRQILLAAEPKDRIGVAFGAEVYTTETTRLDRKGIKQHFGADALEPFTQHVVTDTVRLEAERDILRCPACPAGCPVFGVAVRDRDI